MKIWPSSIPQVPGEKQKGEILKHRNLSLVIVILVIILALPAFTAAFTGLVVGVVDGDTIDVLHNGKAERVRLYGIDCPEKKQPFGRKAKEATSGLAYRKIVVVMVNSHDRYGRTIGKVILPNGKSLNSELVRASYAWWYRRYAPKDFELMILQSHHRC